MARLGRLFVRPTAYFIGVAVVVALIIVTIGETLLRLHPAQIPVGGIFHQISGPAAEFVRPELLTAFGLALLILFVGAMLARGGGEGALDRRVAVGGGPDFWAPATPQLPDATARRGPLGTVADIREGFTLFAQNGPLARVISVLPGETEYGRRRRGFIFASGLFGANETMWIPVEAVMAVYPEAGTVFLAAKGDEIEHFGWNRPPESFRRDEPPHSPPSSF